MSLDLFIFPSVSHGSSRNPLTRCGLDLQLEQETSDRPTSDLDGGTKRGGKKRRRRCGQGETWKRCKGLRGGGDKENIKPGLNQILKKEAEMTTQWKWMQAKVRAEKPTQTEWGRWWLWWRWAVLEVVQWLAVKPQGSWQTCLHATRRKRRVIVVWHGTATGNGLWLRKEIQYRAFTKLQSTRESGAFKHSNTHTSSVDTRLSILPLLKAWFNRTTGIKRRPRDDSEIPKPKSK